jgi:hypothetical protein
MERIRVFEHDPTGPAFFNAAARRRLDPIPIITECWIL